MVSLFFVCAKRQNFSPADARWDCSDPCSPCQIPPSVSRTCEEKILSNNCDWKTFFLLPGLRRSSGMTDENGEVQNLLICRGWKERTKARKARRRWATWESPLMVSCACSAERKCHTQRITWSYLFIAGQSRCNHDYWWRRRLYYCSTS